MSRFRMHYKNKPYRDLGTAIHSETREVLALYECMYPNELGSLWVRPKAMFEESVVVDGHSVGRFRAIPVRVQVATGLTDENRSNVESLLRQTIGDSRGLAEVEQRLWEHGDPLVQVAFLEKDPVGFKLGHRSEEGVFESWLGGVRPDRRGVGVATALMKSQHEWAKGRGYGKVRTKTLNEWRDMLILDLRSGFRVVGTEPSPRGLKIILEKDLA